MPQDALLQIKLVPPRPQRNTLPRPRLIAQLREALDYRVTIVQASTGYGKTTALGQFAQTGIPVFWYTVGEQDIDSKRFLAYLIAAFQQHLPALGNAPAATLHDSRPNAVITVANTLLNALNEQIKQPSFLIIDDYHFASSPEIDALLDHILAFLPADLHAIVSSRYPHEWKHLASWRAHGQVLEIKRDRLAFTRDEIDALFRDKYGLPLDASNLETLTIKTEGWPAALQLLWQGLRATPRSDALVLPPRILSEEGSLDNLFSYLACDVLHQQPPEIQDLLLQTSVLHELEADACAAVTQVDCRPLIAFLRDRDLFLVALGDEHYRLHHLFHDFLRTEAETHDLAGVLQRHRRAGEFFQNHGDLETAIYHWLLAEAFEPAIALIEQAGEDTLNSGRLALLSGWIDTIPAPMVRDHPQILFLRGELARLRSRFDQALNWYAEAERTWRGMNNVAGISSALRGQALVYLDTLHTPQAEELLQQALTLADGTADRESHARLLEMLAENKLNMGRTKEAEELRHQARALREEVPTEDAVSVRVKIRTGHLDSAREILEDWAQQERGQVRPSRAHRETLLLLTLVHSAQGRADDAYVTAQQAIALGNRLDSPLVSVVGQLRLGHAYQIRGELRESLKTYQTVMDQADQLGLPIIRAEARWGMARAHGLLGDLDAARNDAEEGIAIARNSGDLWIVAQIQLALGASQVIAQENTQAATSLVDALISFHACGDAFGSAATWMWLALATWYLDQRDRALDHLGEALALSQAHHYDFMWTTRSLLGWQDPCVILPLLLQVPRDNKHAPYVAHLLSEMKLTGITQHPGYQLHIRTLGQFRLSRNGTEISAREWQRKKARQLLEVLITHRGQMLEREEIFELLWRDAAPEAAARDFKVALNALNKVLEPQRAPDDSPAFIRRVESAYGLSAGIDIWVDADEFTRLVERADTLAEDDDTALELYRRALALHQGDYLQTNAPYEDWALTERERLQTMYLRTLDRLAMRLLKRGDLDECEELCKQILSRDRCWEHAYLLKMRALALRGDTVGARRTYDECERVLRADLGVSPSSATLYALNQMLSGS